MVAASTTHWVVVQVPLLQRPGQASFPQSTTVPGHFGSVTLPQVGLTGTKVACNEGHCGACTVLVDGTPTLSCITLAQRLEGREVTTIEGLRDHPMVRSFVRADAVQCGFCTPGQIVSAAALVAANPSPSQDEIRHAMSGNICRCGTYPKIEEAISTWQD